MATFTGRPINKAWRTPQARPWASPSDLTHPAGTNDCNCTTRVYLYHIRSICVFPRWTSTRLLAYSRLQQTISLGQTLPELASQSSSTASALSPAEKNTATQPQTTTISTSQKRTLGMRLECRLPTLYFNTTFENPRHNAASDTETPNPQPKRLRLHLPGTNSYPTEPFHIPKTTRPKSYDQDKKQQDSQTTAMNGEGSDQEKIDGEADHKEYE